MKSAADLLLDIEETMGDSWLPRIYHKLILKTRTRSYEFPAVQKRVDPQIYHTLLGVELKVGRLGGRPCPVPIHRWFLRHDRRSHMSSTTR